MDKCWNCDKDIPQVEGKKPRHYCNDACRMAYKRAQDKGKSEQAKANKSNPNIKRTNKSEHGLHPAILAKINAVSDTEEERQVRLKRAKAYARMFPNKPCTIIPTTYEMTDSERKNYKPANELAPGQFNPVSKPGAPEYGDEMKPCSGCGKDIRAILTICLSCAEQSIGSGPHTALVVDERTAQ